MSYHALKWSYTARAVLKNGLSPSELAVLRALCWLYRDEGATRYTNNCFPGVAKLSEMTGLKSGAVNKAKRRLRELDLVTWERSANLPGKPRRTNSYRINCPKLEKTLKANERRFNGPDDGVDYLSEDFQPALKSGMMYTRPDPATLLPYFKCHDAAERAEWMADALAFVLDTPDHRNTLLGMLSHTGDMLSYREVLKRVCSTSLHGRRISNRMGYLVSALKKGSPR